MSKIALLAVFLVAGLLPVRSAEESDLRPFLYELVKHADLIVVATPLTLGLNHRLRCWQASGLREKRRLISIGTRSHLNTHFRGDLFQGESSRPVSLTYTPSAKYFVVTRPRMELRA